MKLQMILFLAVAILGAASCDQAPKQNKTTPPKTMPDLKHKQDLVVHGTRPSGGSTTVTLSVSYVDSLYVERIRKKDKDYLYKYFPVPFPNARSYNHIKVALRDQVTGEEVILAEK